MPYDFRTRLLILNKFVVRYYWAKANDYTLVGVAWVLYQSQATDND